MTLRSCLLAAAWLALTGTAQAATVATDLSPFASASFLAGDPAVRFRSPNAGGELYVGTTSTQPPRAETDLTYVATAPFSLFYARATGVISASYNLGVPLSFAVSPGEGFNALRIGIVGPGPAGNSFSLTGLLLNGSAISQVIAGAATGPRVNRQFYLWNFAAPSGDIALSGTLNLFGPFGNTSAEAARIDITLGNVTPVPLPAAGWMLLGAFGGLALLRRRTA